MKLSVITPVFNKCQMTSEFITSVVPYLEGAELIIVDNNSTDQTLSVVSTAKRVYPDSVIKLISNNRNLGFGRANNLGVLLAESENLLFMSNDVRVLGDFVSPVVDYFQSNTRAACGPRLVNFPSGWNSFDREPLISYLEGFCFAVPQKYFEMVGGFDTNFFLDMEDLDLCYRLHLAGVGLAQITLPVMHQLGGSFSELHTPRLDITLQSYNYFCRKWGFTKRD